MKKLIPLLCILLIGCKTNKNVSKTNEYIQITEKGLITVIGIANKDNKGGALIETDDHRYFIQHLRAWPQGILGKKIKATGNLTIIDKRKLFERSPYFQGYPIRYILKDAEWKVVD